MTKKQKQFPQLYGEKFRKEYNGEFLTTWEIANKKIANKEMFVLNFKIDGATNDLLEAFKAVYKMPKSVITYEIIKAGIKVKSDELKEKTGMSIIDVMGKYSTKANLDRQHQLEDIAKRDKVAITQELFAIEKPKKSGK